MGKQQRSLNTAPQSLKKEEQERKRRKGFVLAPGAANRTDTRFKAHTLTLANQSLERTHFFHAEKRQHVDSGEWTEQIRLACKQSVTMTSNKARRDAVERLRRLLLNPNSCTLLKATNDVDRLLDAVFVGWHDHDQGKTEKALLVCLSHPKSDIRCTGRSLLRALLNELNRGFDKGQQEDPRRFDFYSEILPSLINTLTLTNERTINDTLHLCIMLAEHLLHRMIKKPSLHKAIPNPSRFTLPFFVIRPLIDDFDQHNRHVPRDVVNQTVNLIDALLLKVKNAHGADGEVELIHRLNICRNKLVEGNA